MSLRTIVRYGKQWNVSKEKFPIKSKAQKEANLWERHNKEKVWKQGRGVLLRYTVGKVGEHDWRILTRVLKR